MRPAPEGRRGGRSAGSRAVRDRRAGQEGPTRAPGEPATPQGAGDLRPRARAHRECGGGSLPGSTGPEVQGSRPRSPVNQGARSGQRARHQGPKEGRASGQALLALRRKGSLRFGNGNKGVRRAGPMAARHAYRGRGPPRGSTTRAYVVLVAIYGEAPTWRVLDGFGIGGYRSYDTLDVVGPLSKITLLAGQNNVGKTDILEFLRDVHSQVQGFVSHDLDRSRLPGADRVRTARASKTQSSDLSQLRSTGTRGKQFVDDLLSRRPLHGPTPDTTWIYYESPYQSSNQQTIWTLAQDFIERVSKVVQKTGGEQLLTEVWSGWSSRPRPGPVGSARTRCAPRSGRGRLTKVALRHHPRLGACRPRRSRCTSGQRSWSGLPRSAQLSPPQPCPRRRAGGGLPPCSPCSPPD